eukprot:scaffold12580_cov55-Attheya_sp.AAC.2
MFLPLLALHRSFHRPCGGIPCYMESRKVVDKKNRCIVSELRRAQTSLLAGRNLNLATLDSDMASCILLSSIA